MSDLSAEWIDKAEADFSTATRENRVRKAPNYDAVCFHAQQCIEKYLKAILVRHRKAFSKTHDLEFLLETSYLYTRPWKQPERIYSF